jgi:hypothetical protein
MANSIAEFILLPVFGRGNILLCNELLYSIHGHPEIASMSRLQRIQDLKERLREVERSCRPVKEPPIVTGNVLDQLLPKKGWETGTLIEWLGDDGGGAATLALAMAARLLQRGGALVVIDSRREFYPPAAANLGILLERTVVVQPRPGRDALWAMEQSLRSEAVSVALGWFQELQDRTARRLQLAAEAGGGVGFLLRPLACCAEPSWTEVRLRVTALPALQRDEAQGMRDELHASNSLLIPHPSSFIPQVRRFRVEVLHCRGGVSGTALDLEWHDETGDLQKSDVHLASRLARSATAPHAAGA